MDAIENKEPIPDWAEKIFKKLREDNLHQYKKKVEESTEKYLGKYFKRQHGSYLYYIHVFKIDQFGQPNYKHFTDVDDKTTSADISLCTTGGDFETAQEITREEYEKSANKILHLASKLLLIVIEN